MNEKATDFKCPLSGVNVSKIARCKIYILENYLAPFSDLLIRFFLAWVFWKSGVIKFNSFESTLTLFEYEFLLPFFLPPVVAAYAATFVELVAPVLLALGFGARIGAFMLLCTTLFIEFYAYSGFAAQAAENGYFSAMLHSFVHPTTESQIHQLWSLLALVILARGPGRWSIDYYIRKRYIGSCCPAQVK